jgi:hypothetical protein
MISTPARHVVILPIAISRCEREPGVSQVLQVLLRNAGIRCGLLPRSREGLNGPGEPDQAVQALPPCCVADLQQLDGADRGVPAVIATRRAGVVLHVHHVDAVVVLLPYRVGVQQRTLAEIFESGLDVRPVGAKDIVDSAGLNIGKTYPVIAAGKKFLFERRGVSAAAPRRLELVLNVKPPAAMMTLMNGGLYFVAASNVNQNFLPISRV